MNKCSNNVIMFPKWREHLTEDSFRLLREKNYIEALDLFEKLLKYGDSSHEIVFGKLLCLAELERISEAINMLEMLIFEQKKNRFEYLHMYITMLYQTKEYDQLINFVEQTSLTKNFPHQFKKHIEQLYQMSKTYRAEDAYRLKEKYSERLMAIIETNLYQEQRHIIYTFKEGKVIPTEEMFNLLQNQKVHPVIKTDLLRWLKNKGINDRIKIEKLGMHQTVIPTQLENIKEQSIYDDIIKQLDSLESENPSLLALMKKTFKRFLYVWYPFPLEKKQIEPFIEALQLIVDVNPSDKKQKEYDPKVEELMKTISICEALYLSVVED